MHPGVAGEGWGAKRAEKAISKNRWRKTESLRYESTRPCALAPTQEIPIILRDLDSPESRRDRYDAGEPVYSRMQYSIELQIKGL